MIERLGTKLIRKGDHIFHWCPACDCSHSYNINQMEKPAWSFNGEAVKPTFKPSMLLFTPAYDKETRKYDYTKKQTICHYFLIDGNLQYLSDCPHEFKAKTVPLPDFPSGYGIGNDIT